MPRLPVSDGSEGQVSQPTIVVTWWGAALATVAFAVWIAGDVMLADWLGLDLNCAGGTRSSRSSAAEIVICSAAAGPTGWLYLGWLAAPMVVLGWWLKRKLKPPRAR